MTFTKAGKHAIHFVKKYLEGNNPHVILSLLRILDYSSLLNKKVVDSTML